MSLWALSPGYGARCLQAGTAARTMASTRLPWHHASQPMSSLPPAGLLLFGWRFGRLGLSWGLGKSLCTGIFLGRVSARPSDLCHYQDWGGSLWSSKGYPKSVWGTAEGQRAALDLASPPVLWEADSMPLAEPGPWLRGSACGDWWALPLPLPSVWSPLQACPVWPRCHPGPHLFTPTLCEEMESK